jgi:hypothetical protein
MVNTHCVDSCPGWGKCLVSQLYDLKLRVEDKIKADHLDPMEVKGKIGLKSGMLFALISANTPDNPASIEKFKAAAKDVLNLSL